MFEEVPIILGFMLFSIAFSYLVMKYTPKPFIMIAKVIAIFGIIIHEICHIVMCVISRTPIEEISLLKRMEFEKDSTKLGFYGQVKVYEHKVSFLQALLVSFAPLFLSFWIFFWTLNILIRVPVHPLFFVFSIILMISLVISAGPSISDITMIPKAFSYDTQNSLYQVFLVTLSILATWLIEFSSKYLFHEWHIYLIIISFYFVYKFGFQLVKYIFYSLYEMRTKRIDIRNFQNQKIVHRRRKPWKTLR